MASRPARNGVFVEEREVVAHPFGSLLGLLLLDGPVDLNVVTHCALTDGLVGIDES